MFENIPVSSIGAENTFVLHRAPLTCQIFTFAISDRGVANQVFGFAHSSRIEPVLELHFEAF